MQKERQVSTSSPGAKTWWLQASLSFCLMLAICLGYHQDSSCHWGLSYVQQSSSVCWLWGFSAACSSFFSLSCFLLALHSRPQALVHCLLLTWLTAVILCLHSTVVAAPFWMRHFLKTRQADITPLGRSNLFHYQGRVFLPTQPSTVSCRGSSASRELGPSWGAQKMSWGPFHVSAEECTVWDSFPEEHRALAIQ